MKNKTRQLLNNAILETLEGRQMMSAAPIVAATLSKGVLTVDGSDSLGNRLLIDLANKGQQITVDGAGQHKAFNAAQVTRINITTGSGSDYLYINPAIDIPENINSGDGDDTIRTGGGDVIVTAGNGNDWISAKGDSNYIQAGNGNDILQGDKSNNTLVAGSGNDYLVSEGRADQMTAGNGNDTFMAGNGHDTIQHGRGRNLLIGGTGSSYTPVKSGPATNPVTSPTKPTNPGSPASSVNPTGPTKPANPTSPVTNPSPTEPSTPPIVSGVPTIPVTISHGPQINNTAYEPSPIITTLAGPRTTGMVVNVDGLASNLNSGTAITSNYAWDFGDPGGQYNEMTGYNAAHVYDKPGTFTVTLTVTNNVGGYASTTEKVTIAASQRTQIFVNPQHGSDSNNGSANAPLQSLTAAFSRLRDNSEILLHAGQTYYSEASMHVNYSDVLIGRYGTGANPTIMRSKGNGLSTISSYSNVNGLTIQDITIDSPYAASTVAAANKIGVGGLFIGGQNICIRDCTFLNVDDAINENGNPVGVLIEGNSAPLAIGLRGYMVWGQGSEQVLIGNFAANTTKEHIVRLVGLNMVTVEDNNFTNHDGKGCIEMHEGQYGWIVDNAVDGGDIRVGPLGLWGESASSQTDWVKIEDNQLTDTFIYVQSGTHHAMIEDNVIVRNGVQAIAVSGVDRQGRTSMDITIQNNTAVDTGSTGNFLDVGGWASGIVLKDNLWIAPKLVVGSYGTAPVYVDDGSLGCFTQISGNIWPSPVTRGTYANGGINFVGTSMTSSGYLTPAQWNSQGNVGTDFFENLTLKYTYQVEIDSQVAGAALKIAA